MPAFDASLNDRMATHVESQRAALAESWNQCFEEGQFQLQPQGLVPFDPTALPESLQQPGLVALFQEGDTGAVALLPAVCGLPGWYRTPTDSQKSRLDTLAMEWSLNLWPDDHMIERSGSGAVENLAVHLTESHPPAEAALLAINVLDTAGAVVGTFHVVWPVTALNWDITAAPPTPSAPAERPTPAPEPEAIAPPPPVRRGPDPLARLRKLPVMVSVRLAEKKISMSQLLAITPGALVTFNKPCDDLLDLYVNNSLYCRGEAVKIGESFGLKIDHVGVHDERESRLLQR